MFGPCLMPETTRKTVRYMVATSFLAGEATTGFSHAPSRGSQRPPGAFCSLRAPIIHKATCRSGVMYIVIAEQRASDSEPVKMAQSYVPSLTEAAVRVDPRDSREYAGNQEASPLFDMCHRP